MAERVNFDLPPEVESCDMIVVYDRRSGAIRHTHKCFTWRGGRHPSREELEKEAMALAREEGVDLDKVATLHLDPRKVELDAIHRVDVERRTIVARPVPTRGDLIRKDE